MVKIETDLSYVKALGDATYHKLDRFIEKANEVYATKEELELVRESTKENTSTIMDLILKWGPLIGMALVLIFQLVKLK